MSPVVMAIERDRIVTESAKKIETPNVTVTVVVTKIAAQRRSAKAIVTATAKKSVTEVEIATGVASDARQEETASLHDTVTKTRSVTPRRSRGR